MGLPTMTRASRFLPLLALAFVAMLHAVPARAGDVEAEDPHRAAVTRALMAIEGAQGWTTEDIRKRLYQMGDNALPGILDALEQVAPHSRTAAIIGDFLGTHDRHKLEKALRERLGEHPTTANHLRLLRLMGRLGDIRVLPLATEIAGKLDGSVLADPRVGRQWQATLKALVGERPARRDLALGLEDLPRALDRWTADVLVELASADAIAAVVDLLERAAETPVPVLAALRRARPLDLRVDGLAGILRPFLAAPHAAIRVEAAALAARARLGELVPDLVNGLRSADARVKRAAHQALRALTGTDRGPTDRGWRAWLADEQAWRASADLSERLGASDPGTLARSLREVTVHRLACRDLLEEVAVLAQHPEAPVRRLACATLGVLGCLEAAAPLAAALADEDPTVQRAAAQALRVLTGEALGADPSAWRDRLQGR